MLTSQEPGNSSSDVALAERARGLTAELAGIRIKGAMLTSLKAVDEVEAEIVSLTRNTVAKALREVEPASETLAVVRCVITGATTAAEQVGSGLTLSAAPIAKGILLGVQDTGGELSGAAAEIARALIKAANTVREDPGLMVRHAIEGITEAAVELGGNSRPVAAKAVFAALEAAQTLGSERLKSVERMLSGVAAQESEFSSDTQGT
jgi:hypothetical protein